MSNLDFDMVGLSPLAFPAALLSSSLPPFDEGTMAPKNSGMPKLYSDLPEFRSGSVRDDVRELAELLAPGQSVKVQMQQVHAALSKHVRRLTERRVKGMFFGEYDRLWDDEKDGLRRAIVVAKNAKARNAFHAAAVALVRGLHAAGHPLSADQTKALSSMVGAAA
jgi:hypothetical protein